MNIGPLKWLELVDWTAPQKSWAISRANYSDENFCFFIFNSPNPPNIFSDVDFLTSRRYLAILYLSRGHWREESPTRS